MTEVVDVVVEVGEVEETRLTVAGGDGGGGGEGGGGFEDLKAVMYALTLPVLPAFATFGAGGDTCTVTSPLLSVNTWVHGGSENRRALSALRCAFSMRGLLFGFA